MGTSTLYPPNSHLLSNNIVAGAVQCSRRANSAHKLEFGIHLCNLSDCSTTQNNVPHARVGDDADVGFHSRIIDKEISLTPRCFETKNITLKGLQVVAMNCQGESLSEATKNQSGCYTIADLLKLGKQYKRKSRREAQKRYRKRKKIFVGNLDKDVQNIRNEIRTLELQRRRLSLPVPAADGDWDTVVGYFRLDHDCLHLTSDQIQFIRKTMDSNIVYNSEYGIDAMLRSWQLLQWFGSVEEKLVNVNKTTKRSMVATTITKVTITQQTLVNLFPHLIKDDEFRLGGRLLGQRITMCGSICFLWGSDHKRVTSVIAQSDILTPIQLLLGDWEDVAQVFEKSLISPNFQWRHMHC